MAWKGALSPIINELKINFNPLTPQARGVMSFINNQYQFIKSLNPSMPFIVREYGGDDFQPTIQARYAWGVYSNGGATTDISNKSEAEITQILKDLYLQGTKHPSCNPPPMKDIIDIGKDDSWTP